MYHLKIIQICLQFCMKFNEKYSQTKSLIQLFNIVMSNFKRHIIALPNQKTTTQNQPSRSDSKLPGEARMTQGPTSSK